MNGSMRSPSPLPTTVIGLGNEYLSDDGAGIVAVRDVAKKTVHTDVTFQELPVGGIELLNHLVGYDRCIIIDAVASGQMAPGTVVRYTQSPGGEVKPITSSHQLDLNQVLTLAHLLGARVPKVITVFGIEAADTTTFNTLLTPAVARSLPALIDEVCRALTSPADAGTLEPGMWHILSEPVTN